MFNIDIMYASESAVLERHVIFLSLSKTFGRGPVRSVFDCIEAEEVLLVK